MSTPNAVLKKNTADFENMIRSYLEKSKDPLFAVKTKNVTPELEIRFGINKKQTKPISKIDYDNVVHQLLLNGWKTDNIEGLQMLRISNEYYDTNKKTDIDVNANTNRDNNETEVEDQMDKLRGGAKRTNMRMSGSIRLEIVGSDLIQNYCKTNSIDYLSRMDGMNHDKMKFTEKLRVKDDYEKEIKHIDFHDFNFRVAYKAEKDTHIKTENMKYRSILLNWNNTRKYFRLMNRVRFYHDDYPVYVDISIVKVNNTFTRKQKNFHTGEMEKKQIPNYAFTVQECNLFDNAATYEIELELDNRKSAKYEFDAYMAALRKSIRFVLSGLQQTPYPISYNEQEEVVEDYMERMFGESWKETKKPRPFFIGPNSVTLQLENVVANDEEDSSLNSSLIKIHENYAVTEKADGLRSLLYVSKKGKLYMIDSSMKVKFTGCFTKEKTCFDSILDGEFIMYGKNKTLLYMFAAFDIYYIGGRNKLAHVRDLDFCSNDPLEDDENYRLPLLQKFVSLLDPQPIIDKAACKFQVQVKTFETKNDMGLDNIFKASEALWKNGLYPYEIDGLIFTPTNTGVGGDRSKQASDLKSIRWERSFKWKPPQYNTIDFLVQVKKQDGKELIQHIIQDSGEHQQILQYKTLILHCGFNAKEYSMNPFHDMLHDKVPEKKSREYGDTRDDYKPYPFQPTVPYDPQAHLCYMPLEFDNTGTLQMKTVETNDAFYDNMIVEFSYDRDFFAVDGEAGNPWRWRPLRVRYDKIAKLVNGERMYGNNFETANSNWRSIHHPVTEDIIMGHETPSLKTSQEVIYYNLREKDTQTKALRDFHNHFVKRKLIAGVADYLRNRMKIDDPLLIDFAVGEGGDIAKWRDSNIRFVLGIDISQNNLVNKQKGACVRYLSHRRDYSYSKLRALFLRGNSGLNIRSKGKAFYDTFSRDLAQSVFGSGTNMNRKQDCFEHGIARDGFHISSCMFSLHYFFQNNTILHSFLRNLAECTRVHGYFIGACFDGQKVFNLLQNKKENESIVIEKEGVKIFELVKGYKSSIKTFPRDKESVSMPVHVFQESINAMFIEFLVNFEYFVQLMENYGFALVEKEEASKIGFSDSNGLFDMLYRKMEKENYKEINKREYANAPMMSHYEQTISFLNRYFIFKKMRDLSETSLKNLEQDIEEEAEKEAEDMDVMEQISGPTKEKEKTQEGKKDGKDGKEKSKPTGKGRKKLNKSRIKIEKDNYSPVDK